MRIQFSIISADNTAKSVMVRYVAPDLPNTPHADHMVFVPVVDGQAPSPETLQQYLIDVCPMGHFERLAAINDAQVDLSSLVGLSGEAGSPPPPLDSLADAKQRKRQELADIRYNREVGGTPLPSGMSVATDRHTQATITAALNSVDKGFLPYVNWKGPDGEFVQLGLTQLMAIGQAVAEHVQQCFDIEALLLQEVAAAQTVAEVEAIVWPKGVVTA